MFLMQQKVKKEEEEKKEQNKGAVQEPNAFLERHLLKSTYSLFKYLQENNLTQKEQDYQL